MPTPAEQFTAALTAHATKFGVELSADSMAVLERYYLLVRQWTPRLHLVAPCSAEEFATRHVLESLLLLKHLRPDTTVVDVGSGAGLPSLPVLLARPDLRSVLIEASRKKAIFLKEALRLISHPDRARIEHARFEDMPPPAADYLTCRALDRFGDLLPGMLSWPPPGTIFLLYAGPKLRQQIEARLTEVTSELIPLSERRYLIRGRRPDK